MDKTVFIWHKKWFALQNCTEHDA